eukprot:357292-Chlamydomonas_euryale.AAC.6
MWPCVWRIKLRPASASNAAASASHSSCETCWSELPSLRDILAVSTAPAPAAPPASLPGPIELRSPYNKQLVLFGPPPPYSPTEIPPAPAPPSPLPAGGRTALSELEAHSPQPPAVSPSSTATTAAMGAAEAAEAAAAAAAAALPSPAATPKMWSEGSRSGPARTSSSSWSLQGDRNPDASTAKRTPSGPGAAVPARAERVAIVFSLRAWSCSCGYCWCGTLCACCCCCCCCAGRETCCCAHSTAAMDAPWLNPSTPSNGPCADANAARVAADAAQPSVWRRRCSASTNAGAGDQLGASPPACAPRTSCAPAFEPSAPCVQAWLLMQPSVAAWVPAPTAPQAPPLALPPALAGRLAGGLPGCAPWLSKSCRCSSETSQLRLRAQGTAVGAAGTSWGPPPGRGTKSSGSWWGAS